MQVNIISQKRFENYTNVHSVICSYRTLLIIFVTWPSLHSKSVVLRFNSDLPDSTVCLFKIIIVMVKYTEHKIHHFSNF